jgi:hypothetical protein
VEKTRFLSAEKSQETAKKPGFLINLLAKREDLRKKPGF